MSFQDHKVRAVFVASIGGGLEIYDFTIYVFFASILGMLFFPKENNFVSLLDTFAVFAIGYFARPLGGVLFGHFGDRIGRKKGMLFTIALMAIATVGVGLLPTYAEIGIAAPILLVIFRFLQGLAVGGDLPGAITFVAEYADDHRRGLWCSLVCFAVNLGLLVTSIIASLLIFLLSHEQLVNWGWRFAFLLGLLIGIVGFYLRSKMLETPYFNQIEQKQTIAQLPVLKLFHTQRKEVLQSVGLMWLYAVIIAQVFLYMPTYLNSVMQFTLKESMLLNSVNIFIYTLCIPLIGYLSDKLGRKRMILIFSLGFVLFTYPLYALLNSTYIGLQVSALLVFGILSAGIVGTLPSILAEMFITNVRYSGVAVSYNIGFAIFAGLTPVILTFLLYKFQSKEVISINLIVSAVVAFATACFMKEKSNQPLVSEL